MTESPADSDRRPISFREHGWSQAVAHWLATAGVSANAISVIGMIAAIVGGTGFAATRIWPEWAIAGYLVAAAGMQLRLLANMWDGMVAIETATDSPVGAIYNEVPDRVSDVALIVGAGYALGGQEQLGYWAAILAVFVAYIRAQGRAAGSPQDFSGPMAKPQRMFVLTLAALYACLPAAWQFQWSAWPGVGTIGLALAVMIAGMVVTCVVRLRNIAAALRELAATNQDSNGTG